MTNSRTPDTLETVRRIIQDHFHCPDVPIGRATVADDVDGWDSLGYATLIMRIERELEVDLGKGAMSLANVGELVDAIDNARLKRQSGTGATRQEVYRSATCSIVRAGGNGAPFVFFAGLGNRFALTPLLEFERLVERCGAADIQRYYVTDFVCDFYHSCSSEVAAFFAQHGHEKMTFIGNSMGGYGALHFAERVAGVQRVLAFVPQSRIPGRKPKAKPPPQLRSGIEYLILYGTKADARAAGYYRAQIREPDRQRIIMIDGIGHFVVGRLQKLGVLGDVLRAVFTAPDWIGRIEQVLAPYTSAAGPERAAAARQGVGEQRIRG